jgi:phytoene dehydrogenase-like protein
LEKGKSIVVVGAGIAGLSAGCYARMNGYRARIFEAHTLPGGLCTAWSRGDFTVDGCLHWLVGTGPGSPFHRIWEELGALQGREIVYPEVYMRVEGDDGRTLTVHTDLDRFEEHLVALSPADRKTVRRFARDARALTRFRVPVERAPEIFSRLDRLKLFFRLLPHLRRLGRWERRSLGDLAASFSDPLLREAFSSVWFPDSSALFVLLTLAWMHAKEAGYPQGGSLPFARAIERRYRDLGGEISYGKRVAKILVEGGRAVGVRLSDGAEHRADRVVSAADGHDTLFGMLDGRYVDGRTRGCYEALKPFPPLVHVALGLGRTLPGVGDAVSGLSFPVDPPLEAAGKTLRRLTVSGGNDPLLAPAGKTVVKTMFPSDYGYWEALGTDPGRYRAEKEAIADRVVSAIDRRFPGTASAVEMRDVATPLTFHRYTNNRRGSFEGWVLAPGSMAFRPPKTLRGLRGFYMAGHWVEPGGGVPPAALSGRNVLQIICREDGRPFVTGTP